MEAAVVTAFGQDLQIVQRPIPTPRPHEVLAGEVPARLVPEFAGAAWPVTPTHAAAGSSRP